MIPWLRRLGIDPDEMSFEGSFRLRLGHNQVVVGKKRKLKNQVGGRYDTLVRRNGVNLLVVEFKAGELPLDDVDRDQAVSYARLLHPVAPYVLVTNGKDFRLFEVGTKTRVDRIEIRDGYHLELPENLIAEAQELFLNLSLENLVVFCGQQVTSHLKTLTGSPADLAKKYVPELTVPRRVLDGWVAVLEAGDKPGQLVFAESGRGKTSALCDLARRRIAEGRPTLFFSGSELESGLLGAIADEFSWAFMEQASQVHLVKRLAKMTARAPLLIILDAVDEWRYAQRAQNLLGFLRGIEGLGIKVLVSCKTNAWQEFTSPGGRSMGIDAYLQKAGANGTECGQHLPRLDDTEFSEALGRYCDVFKVRGRFESSALAEARRDPFLLRVLFSVAAEAGANDISFSLKDFFARYYDLLLKRTGNPGVAHAQLAKLAAGFAERNQASLPLDEARSLLGLSVTESLLAALFEQDILQTTPTGIGFYFQHLRDYLIAFRVCEWQRMASEAFAHVAASGVKLEAFNFYLRYASTEQMRMLLGPAYDNAEKYVALYEELLDRYFPTLRAEFEPRSAGPIGFIAEYVTTRRCIGGYGFRVLEAGEPLVLIVPVDEFFSRSNLLAIHGASSLYHCSSAHGFIQTDVPKEVVEHEILRQMKTILKDQRLSMRTAAKVPKEVMVANVEATPSYFASLYDEDIRKVQFPLNAAKLRRALLRVKLAHHFGDEIREQKAAAAKPEERNRWRPLTDEDKREVLRRIEEVLATGREVTFSSIIVNVRNLEEDLDRMGALDVPGNVNGPVWPNDYYFEELRRAKPDEAQRQLEQSVGKFYRAFLADYRSVIEENFPALKGAFSLYADLPVRIFLRVDPHYDRHEIKGWVAIIGERLPAGSPDEVIVCSANELDLVARTYRGTAINAYMQSNESLSNFVPWRKGEQPLLGHIYRMIAQEWPKAANAFRAECGVPPRGGVW
ncbi:MAG: type I restriction enzyme HsdR N-terminal domain-containing protein [Lacunisphaera sp.]|nr:type I restriction enzyme HsdR N-terminal domain-containing protein [Lacunisphaera sp.]